jgi:hypothetical protein
MEYNECITVDKITFEGVSILEPSTKFLISPKIPFISRKLYVL